MATLTINKEGMEVAQAGRTLQAFAEDIGVDQGTISRVLNGKAAPGPKLIAAMLIRYPEPFDTFFTPVD